MKSVLRSLRRKLLGETWTIPLGVAGAIVFALAARAVLPRAEWQTVGGFVLAVVLIAAVLHSLSADGHRTRNPERTPDHPHQPTTTRIDP